MSELVITAVGFVLQPLVDARNGPAKIRWAYNRPFLDSDNVQVQWGTQTSGFAVETPCSIADGLIVVDQDTLLWTTDNAQDTNPLSILLSAWLLTTRDKLIQQLQIAGKAQLVVPSSLAPSTSWAEFSNYNQAVALYYYNPNYYNAPEVDRQIRLYASTNYASETHLGGVYTSVEPAIGSQPVAWITDDPLVRDADKIEGVPVSDTPPLDGQVLTYNQANNQYEPTNQAAGTGNVISNEISSVDGQVALASGTGGKTIKFSSIVDDGSNFNAAGMRLIASEYDSDSANLADNGTIRLNKDDFIAWRNEANGGNVILDKDASDRIASTGGFAGALTGNVTGNVSGTAGNLSGTPTLPNGTAATTQSAADNSTKLATTAYVDAAVTGGGDVTAASNLTAGAFVVGDDGVKGVKTVTATVATAALNNMLGDSGSGGTKGLAPAPAAGDTAAGKFLKADGTWSAPSGTGAPSSATYITQVPDSGLSAEQALSALATGLMRVATTTGVVTSITDSAGLAANISDETGSGALVFGTSPVFTTDITLPNGTSPSTGTVAKVAFDTDAWGASRGAIQVHDGTANTYVVAALASDTPTNGQVPTWNTGGTITWETPSGGGGTNPTSLFVPYNNAGTFADSRIKRENTNITGINGGLNTTQTFKVYDSDDGAGNAGWLQLAVSSSQWEMLSTASGSASVKNLILGVSGSSNRLALSTSDLKPSVDRGYDLGGGSNRWNQAFIFKVIINGDGLLFQSGPLLVSGGGGWLQMTDSAGSGNLTRISMGDPGATGVSLTKPTSKTHLEARNGDNTAYVFLVSAATTRVNSDLTNATASLSNLTGLTATLAASTKYTGRLVIKCNNSIAAEGVQFDFNGGTATMTSFWAAGNQIVGGTSVLGSGISTSLAGAINFTTITGETLITIDFSLVVNAAGTIIPRFAENSHTTGTVTAELGTYMWIEQAP